MNKKILVPIIAVVILLLAGGSYLFLSRNASDSVEEEQGFIDEVIPTLSPESVGLKIILSGDKKKVKFTLANASDIKSVAWDFSYDHDAPNTPGFEGDGEGKVQEQFGGEEEVDSATFESPFRELGTCSAGRCRYDTGITEIKLEVNVTKKDGKVYQVSDSLTL